MKKIILALTLILTPLISNAQGRPPAPVKVKKAYSAMIMAKKKVSGNLRAARRVQVASIESGRVDELYVLEGQKVKKGDMLARLDKRRLELDVLALKAQIDEKSVQQKSYQNELLIHSENLSSLEEAVVSFKGSVSARELRDSRLQKVMTEGKISALKAAVKTLAAKLKRLNTSIRDTFIRAPFDGVVISKNVDLGAWVKSGGAVITLSSADKLEAWLDIPQTIAPQNLSDIKSIEVKLSEGGKALKIKSLRILPEINKSSRNYRLIVELENSPEFIAGMSLSAYVPLGKKQQHLLISSDAIARNGAGYYVYKAQNSGKSYVAIPTPVEVLYRQGSELAIKSAAIKAGDLIIIEGNERLFPMTPVQPLGIKGGK
ncbi:MAG: efflux RND transporter periplasmic adaptor subunit [Lentisphaeraceae bacterium]|nr:efflux RND transporter periplasmic adaptor subunit [Lentisphaeraceae bacterium]